MGRDIVHVPPKPFGPRRGDGPPLFSNAKFSAVLMHCNRREAIAGTLALAALPTSARAMGGAALLAGTYAQEGGKGLYPLTATGSGLTVGRAMPSIDNISFGTRSSRFGLLYLLSEVDNALSVYDQAYHKRASCSTSGSGPCYIALNPDQSALAVANYSSGNIVFWALDPGTGLPLGDGQVVQHNGHGPNNARQAEPHAHWVGFAKTSRWLHSVDLGADAIFAHPCAPGSRELGEMRVAYHTPPGAGPRHLARHPRLPIAYLVAELANTLTVLRAQDDGTFDATADISTLPAGFGGASQAAHIALNAAGTRLYISNRGHNSIAVFALGGDGAARLTQHVDCGGNWPRFFLLREDRREMLVANERSGTIARFAVDRDGRLRPLPGGVSVPGVAFLASLDGPR